MNNRDSFEQAAKNEIERSPETIQKTTAVRHPQPGVRRAKAQEGSQADGKISVKLLDANNVVTGDAFDVYAFGDKSATDMTDYLPTIATTGEYSVLHVFKANDGNWYLVWPVLTEVGVATSTVSLTADTIFGRVTNVYGKW